MSAAILKHVLQVVPGAGQDALLPRVMDKVGKLLFLIRLKLYAKFDLLRIDLCESVGMLTNLPVYPAKQVLDDADFGGFSLSVS